MSKQSERVLSLSSINNNKKASRWDFHRDVSFYIVNSCSRSGANTYCATFSEQKVKFDKETFTGADLTAVFGGVECDLRNAIIESDVVINVSSIFGGIDILVPSNVKIKTKSTSIFGGVENRSNTNGEENTHTIYVNGTAIFGGVEIK